ADQRTNPGKDIYGARVKPLDGTLLDGQGFAIQAGGPARTGVRVGFGAGQHLVVWTDSRTVTATDIFGARVLPDKTILDGNGFVVSESANTQQNPAVAWDGTGNYLVVWQDNRGA